MWSSFLGPRSAAPMTHTLLDSRHTASRSAAGDFGQFPLFSRSCLLCFDSPSNRPNRASLLANSGFSFCVNDIGEIGGNRSLHAPTRANIPTSPYGSRRLRSKWNTRNWQTEAGISRSGTPRHRPRRKLLGRKLSPHGRYERRWAASRSQRNWVAAIAGAMTWLRVSSSGGIADAASALVNAMGRRHGRGRRRSRNSLTTT
jgi:hypothetical protein